MNLEGNLNFLPTYSARIGVSATCIITFHFLHIYPFLPNYIIVYIFLTWFFFCLPSGDGPSQCADVLTCGVCSKDFLLADIIGFIQHKVSRYYSLLTITLEAIFQLINNIFIFAN